MHVRVTTLDWNIRKGLSETTFKLKNLKFSKEGFHVTGRKPSLNKVK